MKQRELRESLEELRARIAALKQDADASDRARAMEKSLEDLRASLRELQVAEAESEEDPEEEDS